MLFQMMFAVITPALITGAFAERMKFSTFLIFSLLVGDARLRPARPLGVGRRRLAARTSARSTSPAVPSCTSTPGSRRSRPRSSSASARATAPSTIAASQPALRRDRRGPALVRLVRLQRGQRARRQWARGSRVHHHQYRRGGGGAAVDCSRSWTRDEASADRSGRDLGRSGRSRRHHPGLGLRHPDGGHRRSAPGRRALLRRGNVHQGASSATTTRSTSSASTASAAPGARSRRASSPPSS